MKDSYSFFQNRACEYFPCHPCDDPASFNCLFCYCPLFTLGRSCGGDLTYTASGNKDCSRCMLPHQAEGYDRILACFRQIKEAAEIYDRFRDVTPNEGKEPDDETV